MRPQLYIPVIIAVLLFSCKKQEEIPAPDDQEPICDTVSITHYGWSSSLRPDYPNITIDDTDSSMVYIFKDYRFQPRVTIELQNNIQEGEYFINYNTPLKQNEIRISTDDGQRVDEVTQSISLYANSPVQKVLIQRGQNDTIHVHIANIQVKKITQHTCDIFDPNDPCGSSSSTSTMNIELKYHMSVQCL